MVNPGQQRGFTLIEAMIVVVVLGVLMMVALPAYQSQLLKGRRADAMQALQFVAGRQEQFMLDRSTYTTNLVQLGLASPYISSDGHYSVTAATCAGGTIANCYLLTAAPRAGSPQSDDSKCGSFTLSSTGAKGASGSLGNDCW